MANAEKLSPKEKEIISYMQNSENVIESGNIQEGRRSHFFFHWKNRDPLAPNIHGDAGARALTRLSRKGILDIDFVPEEVRLRDRRITRLNKDEAKKALESGKKQPSMGKSRRGL